MRRILVALLALTFLVGMMPCIATTEEQITLTFAEVMTSPERTLVLEEAIRKYEEAHPNIHIELVSPPYESAETKVASMLAANQELDVVEVRDNTVAAWINNGFLYNMDEMMAAWEGKSELSDTALMTAASMGNATYFVPQYLYVKALMVRLDILEKLGITEMPKTTDEFLEVCRKITNPEKGQYAFALRGIGSPCKTTDVMWATEVPDLREDNLYLTKDGQFYMDTEGGRKAIDNYYKLFTECCPPDSVNWGFNEQINGFISGTTPFLVQDPDAVGSVSKSLSPEQYSAISMPLGASGKRYLDYGYAGLAVAANSAHPKEAFDFVTYMISTEVNARICEFYGALPVNMGVYEVSEMFNLPVYKAWADEMADEHTVFTKFPVEDPRFAEYSSSVHLAAYQSFLLGNSTAEDLIAACKNFWGY